MWLVWATVRDHINVQGLCRAVPFPSLVSARWRSGPTPHLAAQVSWPHPHLGSMGELAMVVWTWESWPLWNEYQRAGPVPYQLQHLGELGQHSRAGTHGTSDTGLGELT